VSVEKTDLLTEKAIQLLNANVALEVFNVSDLNVDILKLSSAFAPEFEKLPWDFYDQRIARFNFLKNKFPEENSRLDSLLEEFFYDKISSRDLNYFLERLTTQEKQGYDAIAPFRRRSVGQFHMAKLEQGAGWCSERRPLFRFSQAADKPGDYRALKREFAPMTATAADNELFQKLLAFIADRAEEASDIKRPRALYITAHMVSLQCDATRPTSNSPEGIHQDGADFIVSALVMRRENVQGGVSKIYGPDRVKTILEYTLQVGEGIFQSDYNTPLWHEVSPVNVESPNSKGFRDTLGFDVQIL
jgi:hypothetical protein